MNYPNQSPPPGSHRINRDLALLFLAVTFFAAPFLSQPFHMDDNFYMDMARNARQKPLYPNDTPYVFEGRWLADMGSHSHPPLQTYFLAVIQRFAGEGPGTEWIYHTCALLYPLLAVVSFYFLSMRFVERPLWPAMLLAVCPLFMVMQHNLMTDVPTLAFWLAAIAAFLWALDIQSGKLFVLSGLFLFAAMFTSYQSAALIPLLGFCQLRKKGGLAGWLALLVPVAGMAAWFVLNYHHYHRFLLGDTLGFIGSQHAGTLSKVCNKLVAILQYQGWLIIFPLFVLYAWARGLRGRSLGLACLGAAYLAQWLVPQYRLADKLVFITGIVTGFFVFLQMARLARASLRGVGIAGGGDPVEAQFLGLWYLGVMSYCILVFADGSARYILPLIPPVLICFFAELQASETAEYRVASPPLLGSAKVASGALVLGLAWGLLLSRADLEFARIYPQAAQEFSRIASGTGSFYAGEWGFRYYFSHAGIKQIPVDESKVVGGSWLARPRLALPYDESAALMSMTMPVQRLSYEPGTPIRLLDRNTPAGFYSNGWGLIPFSVSRKTLEEVEIRQVNFMVERLPWARAESASGRQPWPGYLEIQGRSPLGVLFKPGTRLVYPWTYGEPLRLDLLCGLSADAYEPGIARQFGFEVAQRDDQGRTLVHFTADLNPGIVPEDRKWRKVTLLLKSESQGAKTLEFSFGLPGDASSKGTAAFSETLLRKP